MHKDIKNPQTPFKGQSNLKLSIIGGKHKGKKIALPPLETTRSSKSILRGSFFDTLQFEIIDKVFIECFAGSGSVGLEALSRGAKKAYFFEIDKISFDMLQKNIKQLGEEQKSTAIFGDLFTNLPRVLNELKSEKKELYFYFDPPFCIREGMDDIYEKTVNIISKIPRDGVALITIEHLSSIKLPEKLGTFSLKKTKKFGKSSLTYYEVSSE